MVNMRRKDSAAFKPKVALEAVKGEKTITQISSEFGIHPNQIRQWRKKLLEMLPDVFSDKRKRVEKDRDELEAELYRQIGQLKVELENRMIAISRQCELLGLCQASYYYSSQRDESYNLILMNLIVEQFTRTPFYGVPKMMAWLRSVEHQVNHKRVRWLMRLMGLEAIYPKPQMIQSHPEHKIYPYLLKGVRIDHADQVWCTDITYIRLLHGFVYLVVVIMDWYSRYILSWQLSVMLEKEFCVQALEIVNGKQKYNGNGKQKCNNGGKQKYHS